jgi:peptidoglycan/LPS O-acetylase OafA/YrhL
MTWNDFLAWSISAEWYAYLLFPLLVAPLLTRLPTIIAVGVVGFSLAPELAILILSGGGNKAVGPIVFVRAVPEFMVGILLYRCFINGWLAGIWRSNGTFVLLLSTISILSMFHFTEIPIIALLAALLLCCAHNRGKASMFLQAAPVLFLGRISYSLYMLQGAAVFAVVKIYSYGVVTDPAALGLLMAVLSFALAVPVSRFVEYPARALLRSYWRGGGRSAQNAGALGTTGFG